MDDNDRRPYRLFQARRHAKQKKCKAISLAYRKYIFKKVPLSLIPSYLRMYRACYFRNLILPYGSTKVLPEVRKYVLLYVYTVHGTAVMLYSVQLYTYLRSRVQ